MNSKTELFNSINEIAQQERDKMEYQSWPECWQISTQIRDALIGGVSGLSAANVNLAEYRINGLYRHYAVKIAVDINNGYTTVLVDGSFDQFATETDTPINICRRAEIDPITVVTPIESYVFHENKTNKYR